MLHFERTDKKWYISQTKKSWKIPFGNFTCVMWNEKFVRLFKSFICLICPFKTSVEVSVHAYWWNHLIKHTMDSLLTNQLPPMFHSAVSLDPGCSVFFDPTYSFIMYVNYFFCQWTSLETSIEPFPLRYWNMGI